MRGVCSVILYGLGTQTCCVEEMSVSQKQHDIQGKSITIGLRMGPVDASLNNPFTTYHNAISFLLLNVFSADNYLLILYSFRNS